MEIPTTKRPEPEDELPPFISLQEMLDQGAEINAWYDERIIFDRSNNTCTLLFAYRYEIDLDRVRDVTDILGWTLHLLNKPWLKRDDVLEIINRIAEFKNIEIYR